jgi:hypothetical protein
MKTKRYFERRKIAASLKKYEPILAEQRSAMLRRRQ